MLSIPEEIKEALSALSQRIRWRIIELIREEKSMSYTEILVRLGIQKGSLTYNLDRLMEAGILDNYSGEEFGGPYRSYYQLSPFGKDLIAGILSSIEVPPFLERKEKPQEPRTFDFPKHEMQKQSEYVSIEEWMRALKTDFKESEEPSIFYHITGKKTMDNARGKNSFWLQRELKLGLKDVKANE